MNATILTTDVDIDTGERETIATVRAEDYLPFVELTTPARVDSTSYLTREEAKELADALLWASAEASD
jgi:hypothetical protein